MTKSEQHSTGDSDEALPFHIEQQLVILIEQVVKARSVLRATQQHLDEVIEDLKRILR